MADPRRPEGKQPPARPARRQADRTDQLWVIHREESVYFQREAQVNFWTVLGGLAVAALLTQLSALWQAVLASRGYLLLFLVASVLILATSWVQTSWGSLVLRWPISIYTTVVMLFQMLAQSVQCLLITNPAGWLAATAVLIGFALMVQLYFDRSGAWTVFPDEFTRRFRINSLVYLVFMLICLVGAYQLYRYPSRTAETIWGIVVVCLSSLALFMQHRGMQEEKRALKIP